MQSDVVNRAAGHTVDEVRVTDVRAECEVTGRGRVSLRSLSLQDERSVLRAIAVDDSAVAGFQSCL